jgi:LacI family transcriptional regulator
MARVTLKKVAELAGVGSATVERVLNGRGGVRPALVEKVLRAARKLDYPKRLPEQHRGVTRIDVLMSRPDLSFIARLSKSFERIAANLDRAISVHRTFLNENEPQVIAQRIMAPANRRSALIVALPQHPLVTEALRKVAGTGLPIIQIVTRMGGLEAPYVGIDNEAAGRTAGLLMAGLQRQPGKVVALSHSQIYAVHRDRMRGFSQYMQNPHAAHLEFDHMAFTYDDGQEAAAIVSRLLRGSADLVGIYSAGGDYGPLCDLLRRSAQQRNICLIGHELTDLTAKALRDGTMSAIIDQAPETQARRAIDMALHMTDFLDTAADPSPIRFVTITAENL